MPPSCAEAAAGGGRSPAEGVHLPRLGGAARAAVTPADDAQRRGRGAALGAVDRLLGVGSSLADLLRPLLVDGPVTPAGATQVCFCAASRPCGDGVPPRVESCTCRRYSGAPAPPGCSRDLREGRQVDMSACRDADPHGGPRPRHAADLRFSAFGGDGSAAGTAGVRRPGRCPGRVCHRQSRGPPPPGRVTRATPRPGRGGRPGVRSAGGRTWRRRARGCGRPARRRPRRPSDAPRGCAPSPSPPAGRAFPGGGRSR